MANTIDIRRRIRSVKNTQQITKAMKMVSAAKLRRAQERMFAARPYAAALRQVLSSVATRAEELRHPLLETREEQKILLLVVSSDKGLAGAFNANVIKAAQNAMRERNWTSVELLPIGRKANDFFRRRPIPIRREATHVGNGGGDEKRERHDRPPDADVQPHPAGVDHQGNHRDRQRRGRGGMSVAAGASPAGGGRSGRRYTSQPENNMATDHKIGKVIQIIGPAVDIEFEEGHLPAINNAVRITDDGALGKVPIDVVAEVAGHIGESQVRCIAMKPTDGMVRGMKALDLGGPISVPVGNQTLGRILNVLGEPVDNKGEVAA